MATYITQAGDQWDMIAKDLYDNELMAGYLMRANTAYLEIYQFDAGIELEVPELPDDAADGLPPWRD